MMTTGSRMPLEAARRCRALLLVVKGHVRLKYSHGIVLNAKILRVTSRVPAFPSGCNADISAQASPPHARPYRLCRCHAGKHNSI